MQPSGVYLSNVLRRRNSGLLPLDCIWSLFVNFASVDLLEKEDYFVLYICSMGKPSSPFFCNFCWCPSFVALPVRSGPHTDDEDHVDGEVASPLPSFRSSSSSRFRSPLILFGTKCGERGMG